MKKLFLAAFVLSVFTFAASAQTAAKTKTSQPTTKTTSKTNTSSNAAKEDTDKKTTAVTKPKHRKHMAKKSKTGSTK